MALCGFNQKMLEGLTSFHEGLVEHGLVEHSRIRNQTIDETLHRELDDMNRFLAETHRISNPQTREMIETLTSYTKAFYTLMQEKDVDKYKEVIQRLSSVYFSMDSKYYSELEGKPEDMKQLAEYLNEVKV